MGKGSGDMDKRIHKPYSRRLLALALVIALCFTAMTGPVCAADDPDRGALCGKTAHSHTAGECYTESMELVCALEENEEHSHSDECYASVTEFFCGMEEHVHSSFCYARTMGVTPARTENGTQEAPETPAPEETAAPAPSDAPASTNAPVEETPEEPEPEETPDSGNPVEPVEETLAEPTEEMPHGEGEAADSSFIYFDLAAGQVTINATSYKGYVYEYGTETKVEISGNHSNENKYYVYQSSYAKRTESGYNKTDKTVILPEYERVSYNGQSWNAYVTNNTNPTAVADNWTAATQAVGRSETANYVSLEGSGVYHVTIDNLWSTKNEESQSRKTGGVCFSPTTGGKAYISLVGDSRFGNIYYEYSNATAADANGFVNGTGIVFQNGESGSQPGSVTVVSYSGKANHYDSVIGGNDNGTDDSDGIIILSGVIYAGARTKTGYTGSKQTDNCSAIGGGGNGRGTVTIKGGVVTAVVSSTGAAIGGGIGENSAGGIGVVTITSGEVYAYNFGYTTYSSSTAYPVPAAAIGGASSREQAGNTGTVTISGGEVYALSVGGAAIGGGSSTKNKGGNTEVTISGNAVVTARSIAGTVNGVPVDAGVSIGGGTAGSLGSGVGGNAKLTISGGTIRTGSIGGGACNNATKIIGNAEVAISGGSIQGQVIMAKGANKNCAFTMTGGVLDNSKKTDAFVFLKTDGGAVWMDDNAGVATVSGGTITGCTAQDGGAVYMTAGSFTLSGDAVVSGSSARTVDEAGGRGGAIYLGSSGDDKGTFTMTGGKILACSADVAGGAIYLDGGDAAVSGGSIGSEDQPNAAPNGGGAYLDGGMLSVSDSGSFAHNIAGENGGGAYLNGGTLTMTGGSFEGNRATTNGGGAYITGGDFNLNGETASLSGNMAESGAGIYLTGGDPNLLVGALCENKASADGGGIYIDRQKVELKPTGAVTITGNEANRGAGIFIGGTDGEDAGFSVDSASSGTVDLSSNTATAEGGAVCIRNGYFNLAANNIALWNNQATGGGAVAVLSGNFLMSDGVIGGVDGGNHAQNGGAVYVSGGEARISGGAVQFNEAENGGGVFVDGGLAAISGGSVNDNTATANGGGIAVNDGKIIMSGGSVSGNTARSGHGGGMFVSSSAEDEVAVMVYSGTVSNNVSAAASGGAVAVVGSESSDILVQIGVNEKHYTDDGQLALGFEHTEDGVIYTHMSCPVIENNRSYVSGGAFYITGGKQTVLNMYCLDESGNNTSQDKDINGKVLSNFLQVEGGAVIISTSETSDYEGVEPGETGVYGHAVVNGSVHVTAGTLDLYGTMENPSFKDYLTIDLTKDEDHFIDHRYSENIVKLSYHENFYIDGAIDSAQTAMDVVNGTMHTILGCMYGHPGYDMIGWNTDEDADAATEDGWYRPTEQYCFVIEEEDKTKYPISGDAKYQVGSELTLYAIWEPNAYFVTYDANTNGEKYSGSMQDDTFSYDQYEQLAENKFVWSGHTFAGWKYTKDDGTESELLRDKATVRNLTAVKGATVTLRAQWVPCDHPEEKVTYSVEAVSEQEQILKKTCTCGYEAGVTLMAEDAVYDGTEHKYHIVYSDEAWTPVVSVTAVRIKPADAGDDDVPADVPEEKRFTDAGFYTVSVTGGEGDKSETATVEYTIAKAEQPAPTEVPQYVKPTEGGNVLTITPITAATSPTTKVTKAEYAVKYYETDGTEQILGWKQPEENSTIDVELPQNLKNYYVYVRYEENDNYLPSNEVMAPAYFHYGDVTIRVESEEGIIFELKEADSGLLLHTELQEEFYLEEGKFSVEKTEGPDNILTIGNDSNEDPKAGEFLLTCDKNQGEQVTITLTVGSARKTPVPLCRVGPGQMFGTVSGTTAAISRDSAYTVYFELKNYDAEYYRSPVLSFNSDLPAGTTIILQNKTDGSYWSATLESAQQTVPLDEFIRMGTENEEFPALANGDLQLQFVVDFSRTSMGGEKFTTALVVAKKEGIPVGVPDISEKMSAEVSLLNTAHTLSADEGIGSVRTLTCGFTEAVSASRWDDRDLALVLTPKSGDGFATLPPDAVLRASVGDTYVDCRPTIGGKFIVPVGEPGTVTLELRSAMFPSGTSQYAFDVDLYSAASIAERAPLNGTKVAELPSLKFSVTEAAVSLKVTGTDDNNKRVFNPGETISVKVTTGDTLPEGYKVVVQLHQKNTDGTYINRGQSPTIGANGTYSFSLTGFASGSYCVVAMVQRDTGLTVAEAPYYFIVQ